MVRSIGLKLAACALLSGCALSGTTVLPGAGPKIVGLDVPTTGVLPGSVQTLKATVRPGDDGKLTLLWSVNVGSLADPRTETTAWLVPTDALFVGSRAKVTLKVVDSHDRSDQKEAAISIQAP